MNQVTIGGYLARDPEVRFTQQGQAVTSFTVAVNKGKDKGAYFINCVAWDKLAENVADQTAKGTYVVVTGRIQVRSYEKDGQKRYVTEIVANSVTKGLYIGSRNEKSFDSMGSETDEEIPF